MFAFFNKILLVERVWLQAYSNVIKSFSFYEGETRCQIETITDILKFNDMVFNI